MLKGLDIEVFCPRYVTSNPIVCCRECDYCVGETKDKVMCTYD